MANTGSIAIIGTGRLGSALAMALHRHGLNLAMVASRGGESAAALAAGLPGCRSATPHEAAQADLVFLSVPDDRIAPLASELPWRAGQSVVHCSGATEVAALQAAATAGALTGGFHPLQIFSDPGRAVELLKGSSVAIEGPPLLADQLIAIAQALGMRPLTLPPGARALYHGAASYAASFLLSMLQETVDVWQRFGMSEASTLAALLPLARGTLDAAAARGLASAVAGPVSRGDAGVIARHVDALKALGGDHAALYQAFTRRQLALVQTKHRLNDEQAQRIERLLDGAPPR